MVCTRCKAKTEEGFTTSVTDTGSTLVIIRNVPCCKCSECTEVMYTADVVRQLEMTIDCSRRPGQEIAVIDYQTIV